MQTRPDTFRLKKLGCNWVFIYAAHTCFKNSNNCFIYFIVKQVKCLDFVLVGAHWGMCGHLLLGESMLVCHCACQVTESIAITSYPGQMPMAANSCHLIDRPLLLQDHRQAHQCACRLSGLWWSGSFQILYINQRRYHGAIDALYCSWSLLLFLACILMGEL